MGGHLRDSMALQDHTVLPVSLPDILATAFIVDAFCDNGTNQNTNNGNTTVISATIMTASSLEASEASHSAATVIADFAAWRNQHIITPEIVTKKSKRSRPSKKFNLGCLAENGTLTFIYLVVFVSYFILTIHFLIQICSRPGSGDCGALDELYIQHPYFCGRVPAFNLTL
jgi:hypothetical protein